MTDLITEARELCGRIEAVHAWVRNGEVSDIINRAGDIIPELCDALEKGDEQNKQLMHEVCKLACESVEREKTLARLEAEVNCGAKMEDKQ